jgi:hypothetical protein
MIRGGHLEFQNGGHWYILLVDINNVLSQKIVSLSGVDMKVMI